MAGSTRSRSATTASHSAAVASSAAQRFTNAAANEPRAPSPPIASGSTPSTQRPIWWSSGSSNSRSRSASTRPGSMVGDGGHGFRRRQSTRVRTDRRRDFPRRRVSHSRATLRRREVSARPTVLISILCAAACTSPPRRQPTPQPALSWVAGPARTTAGAPDRRDSAPPRPSPPGAPEPVPEPAYGPAALEHALRLTVRLLPAGRSDHRAGWPREVSLPGLPQDPDVRNSRIRLVGTWVRYVTCWYMCTMRGGGSGKRSNSANMCGQSTYPAFERRESHLRQMRCVSR